MAGYPTRCGWLDQMSARPADQERALQELFENFQSQLKNRSVLLLASPQGVTEIEYGSSGRGKQAFSGSNLWFIDLCIYNDLQESFYLHVHEFHEKKRAAVTMGSCSLRTLYSQLHDSKS